LELFTHVTLGLCQCNIIVVVLCLSVCLSQACIVSKQLHRSNWFLAYTLYWSYPALCFQEINAISTNKATYIWNFISNSGLTGIKNCTAARRKVLSTVDRRWSLVYHTHRPPFAYSAMGVKQPRRGIINNVPTTIACLSFLASSFVYNAVGVMQHVARVRQRQLRLDIRLLTIGENEGWMC